MKLDQKTLSVIGESLDQHNVPAEDRRMLFVIDGIDYRLDAAGCWKFVDSGDDIGWARCSLPDALQACA